MTSFSFSLVNRKNYQMHKDSSTKQYLEISVYVYIWILEYNGRIWLQLGYRGNSETDYWEMDIRSDTRLFTLPFQNNFIQSHWQEFSNSGYSSGIQRSNRYYLADLQGRRAGRGVWDRVSDSWSFSYFKRLLCCDLWHFLGSIEVDGLLDTLKVLDELQHVLLHPFMRQTAWQRLRGNLQPTMFPFQEPTVCHPIKACACKSWAWSSTRSNGPSTLDFSRSNLSALPANFTHQFKRELRWKGHKQLVVCPVGKCLAQCKRRLTWLSQRVQWWLRKSTLNLGNDALWIAVDLVANLQYGCFAVATVEGRRSGRGSIGEISTVL